MLVFEALIPIIDTVVGILMTLFEKGDDGSSIFSNLMTIILKVVDVILMLLEAFMPIVTLLLDNLLPIIIELADAFIEYLMPVILEVIDALLPFLEMLMPMIDEVATLFISLMPIIQWVLRLFIQLAQKLMTALMPVIMELINVILDNREMLKTLLLMVGLFITILIALMPIIDIIAVIIIVLIKVLSWLIDALVKVVKFIIKGVLWAFDKWLQVIGWLANALGGMMDMLDIQVDALDDFKDGIKRAREEVQKMSGALDDIADAEGIDEESLVIDELPEIFADEVVDGIEEKAEETGLGLNELKWDDDNFDDDIEVDAELVNPEEVAEHVLSGTSVQDILDIQSLTGVTPSAVGPEGTLRDSGSGDTTIIIDKIEVVLEGSDTDPENFVETVSENVIYQIMGGSGSGGQKRE